MTHTQHTSPLTDEDKTRIRAEVIFREEVRREVTATHPEPAKSRIFAFLNSKFVISVVVAAALTTAPKLYLDARARSDIKAARDTALHDKRFEMVASVANDLSRYTSLKGSWQRRKLWLANPDTPTLDGRSKEEVNADYLDLYKTMMAGKRPDAALTEVRSFFDSHRVTLLADQTEKALDSISDAMTAKEIPGLVEKEDKLRDQLIRAMVQELRNGPLHD